MIRDSEFAGKLFARDLGGHLNYTKLRTNCTLQEKIAQFAPFWQRLCRSFATASQKERALVVAAWPNLFYGVCTVTMGKVHFEKLRTQACRALNYTRMVYSPMLQCRASAMPKLTLNSTVLLPLSCPSGIALWKTCQSMSCIRSMKGQAWPRVHAVVLSES